MTSAKDLASSNFKDDLAQVRIIMIVSLYEYMTYEESSILR